MSYTVSTKNKLSKSLYQPSTWILIILFILITLFQYGNSLHLPSFLANANENLGLTRYSLERMLYLLPIIWAGASFGWIGGVISATVAVACMLPRGIFISPHPEDAIVEIITIFIIGITVSFSLESLHKERERRAQLEIAEKELKSQLLVIEENEKRLAALNHTSSIISQSLELHIVLESAITSVIDVMGIEVVRIYILDDVNGELELAAHRGISEEFVHGVSKIKLGEGLNGKVAQTGEPLVVEDSSEAPELTKTILKNQNIRSQIIVPMMAKGKVVGTISAAMRSHRQFHHEEADLLTAIANLIGVAIDNARLYQGEKEAKERLRSSEERYRGIFENAHEAILLHDLNGNILAANDACVQLTGYTLDELHDLKATELISTKSLTTLKRLEENLLSLRFGSKGEVKLMKKDGSETLVEMASSLMFNDGRPVAVQHIARDVTEEKRMQENLKFFVQQITRAQEEERKRIAQELHDDTIQALVVHTRGVENLKKRFDLLPKAEISAYLDELYRQANNIISGIRRLSQDLRPAALDRLGLLPAVEWIADRTAEYSGVKIGVQFVGEERRLPDEAELVLFRITQEALRNVWKHAKASKAEVRVEFEEKTIRITIRDDGIGFELPTLVTDLPRFGMLGLVGMQERVRLLNGTLQIDSKPGEGTVITAELTI